jgi:hypothetical protein
MMGRRILICRRYGAMFIELLTAANLFNPLVEVRHRARYSYRNHHRRPAPRIAPFHENVGDAAGLPAANAKASAEPHIVIIKPRVSTGENSFRERWNSINEDTRKGSFGK